MSEPTRSNERKIPPRKKWNWVAIDAISTVLSALVVSIVLIVTVIQLQQTSGAFEVSSRMRKLELQSSLRERWIEWYDRTRSLDIENYPADERTYSEKDRALIREYWSIVAFHEFAIIHEFQKGLLRDMWKRYESYILVALANEALAEEWFYFVSTPERGSQTMYRREINRIVQNVFPNIDTRKVLRIRKERTSP
jgi:hypothetical protein